MPSSWTPALLILLSMAAAYGLAVIVGEIDTRRRRRKLLGRRSGPSWPRRLAMALMVGAIVSLLLAFGQFRITSETTGGTVVLAIDISHSMNATDVEPNRLAAAEVAAGAFLERLPSGFRVGLVTFSRDSAISVPPTSDRERIQGELGALAIDPSTGTAIGDGLSSALDAIEADRGRSTDRPAAIVLLSDGRDSSSSIPPDQAIVRAQQLGVPVFTVAIGETASSANGTQPNLLGSMAVQTGADAYTTRTSGELTSVYQKLGTRISKQLAIGRSAGPFLIVAVLLTLASAAVLLLGLSDRSQARTVQLGSHRSPGGRTRRAGERARR